MPLTTFTIKDLEKLDLCYNPTKYLPASWSGTYQDILNVKACPAEDRLVVVYKLGVLPDNIWHGIVKQIRANAIFNLDNKNRSVKFSAYNAVWFSNRLAESLNSVELVLLHVAEQAMMHFKNPKICDDDSLWKMQVGRLENVVKRVLSPEELA